MSVTTTAKPLINTQFATTTSTTYYTTPSSTKTIIDKFTVNEVAGATPTVTVWVIPSGETESNDWKMITTEALAANTAEELATLKNHVLDAGDYIKIEASANSQVVIRCSGREVATS